MAPNPFIFSCPMVNNAQCKELPISLIGMCKGVGLSIQVTDKFNRNLNKQTTGHSDGRMMEKCVWVGGKETSMLLCGN